MRTLKTPFAIYVRVSDTGGKEHEDLHSPDDQEVPARAWAERHGEGDSGLGLEAQRSAIVDHCERHGWELVGIEEDGASGKQATNRAGLTAALDACRGRTRRADGVVVAKLDRMSRSLVDAGRILDESRARGFAIVALDVALDTSTATGRAMAGMVTIFAQWEHETIGERTSVAMMAKKRAGWSPPQHQHKRPLTTRHRRRIAELDGAGESIRAIARKLDRHPETVRRVLAAGSSRPLTAGRVV